MHCLFRGLLNLASLRSILSLVVRTAIPPVAAAPQIYSPAVKITTSTRIDNVYNATSFSMGSQFENLIGAGLLTLPRDLLLRVQILSIAATPASQSARATSAQDFKHISITVNNPRYGDLLAIINSLNDPTYWFPPRSVPYAERRKIGDVTYFSWPAPSLPSWSFSSNESDITTVPGPSLSSSSPMPSSSELSTGTSPQQPGSLGIAITRINEAGYGRNGWRGVRLLLPRKDILSSVGRGENEICYLFYRTDDWARGEGVIVGSVSWRVKPFGLQEAEMLGLTSAWTEEQEELGIGGNGTKANAAANVMTGSSEASATEVGGSQDGSSNNMGGIEVVGHETW